MPPARHLHLVTTPEREVNFTPGVTPREQIDHDAAQLGGAVLARVPYEGEVDHERGMLDLYRAEAAMYPLLTKEQEFLFGTQIQNALAAKQLKNDIPEGQPVPAHIERTIAEGEIARAAMISANLRLVINQSNRYVYQNKGLSRVDLIQEGSIGLIKAVEKFDPQRGTKFSTIAVRFIRGEMMKAIYRTGARIAVKSDVRTDINNLHRVETDLRLEQGGEPTIEQIAARGGLTTERVEELRVYELLLDNARLQPIRTGSDGEEYEDDRHLVDPKAQEKFELVERQLFHGQIVEELLSELNERERAILELRFGFADGQVRTLEEVGEVYKVTRERIRQIEAAALKKLRAITGQVEIDIEDLG